MMWLSVLTTSPGRSPKSRVASGPASTTSPRSSWPMTRASFPSAASVDSIMFPKARRNQMPRSEPQKPANRGFTMTMEASRWSLPTSRVGRGTRSLRSPLELLQGSFFRS